MPKKLDIKVIVRARAAFPLASCIRCKSISQSKNLLALEKQYISLLVSMQLHLTRLLAYSKKLLTLRKSIKSRLLKKLQYKVNGKEDNVKKLQPQQK